MAGKNLDRCQPDQEPEGEVAECDGDIGVGGDGWRDEGGGRASRSGAGPAASQPSVLQLSRHPDTTSLRVQISGPVPPYLDFYLRDQLRP